MKLQMTVRDCLYLNWALPAEALPEPPAPLRYQVHTWQGQDWVFASALLFHQDAVHLAALPLLRVGYPQFNLRFYVLDKEGIPSVLFRRMLMPAWVAPGVRLVSHQPALAARLDFPRPSADAGDGPWSWRVERGGTLRGPGLARHVGGVHRGRRADGPAPGLLGRHGAATSSCGRGGMPRLRRTPAPDRRAPTTRDGRLAAARRSRRRGAAAATCSACRPRASPGHRSIRPGSARKSRSPSSSGWFPRR